MNKEEVENVVEGVDEEVVPESGDLPSQDLKPSSPSWSPDSWDGEVDTLPDDIKPVVEKFASRYEDDLRELERLRKEEEDLQEVRKIYESFIYDREDPRLKKLNDDLAVERELREQKEREIEETRARLDQESARARQLDDLTKQIVEDDVARKVDEFKSKNAWIFDNGPMESEALSLLESGFEPDHLPELLRMDRRAKEFARERIGKNPHAASEIVLLAKGLVQTADSGGAELVSGSSIGQITSPGAEIGDTQNMDRRGIKEAIAARHIAKFQKLSNSIRRS